MPDMESLESGLRAALLRDGARMLESLLNDPLCQGVGADLGPGEKRYRRRTKTVETLFGEITIERDYIVGRDGSGRAPLDESLGLLEGYSPGLAKMMARMAAQQSFEMGGKDLLFYAGVRLDAKAIARMVALVGPGFGAAPACPPAEEPEKPINILYIQADGTGVPVRKSETRGRKAKSGDGEAKTREVKIGAIFTQTTVDKEGKPLRDPDSTSYLGTFRRSEDFGALLRAEAFARGYSRAKQAVYLGDGAPWVWELARINFPQATCILDFYHATEHLGDLAKVLYAADPPRLQLRVALWKQMLLDDRLPELLDQARNDLPDLPGPRAAAQTQIAYFETNATRMTYAAFRSRGFFIGSGVVEAACKTVVGKRFKNSGMFWTVSGAQNVLDLRTALLSGRFDSQWAQSRAAA